jgi:hypothetical protein
LAGGAGAFTGLVIAYNTSGGTEIQPGDLRAIAADAQQQHSTGVLAEHGTLAHAYPADFTDLVGLRAAVGAKHPTMPRGARDTAEFR